MSVVIRPPEPDEMAALGKLAGSLVRLHHSFDPGRFILVEPLEEGYTRFLTRMAADPKSVVLAAIDDELGVVGYTYARLEGRDWNRLLDEHGKLHDIAVDPRARRRGIARQIATETFARLRALGATRIILETAHANVGAQQLFASLGFRPTMIEMLSD